MAEQFDVLVLGGGPGGYAAALYGAAAGLRIGLVEEQRVGGTCLHRGCIPAKELLQTAEVLRTVRGAKEFGVEAGEPKLDLRASQTRKQQVVDRLTRGLESPRSPAPARWSPVRTPRCAWPTATRSGATR
jgi:dihydrolipoamide dehydrogenase